MVVLKDGKITDVDLFEAVKVGNRPVSKDDNLVKVARDLDIYIGEE